MVSKFSGRKKLEAQRGKSPAEAATMPKTTPLPIDRAASVGNPTPKTGSRETRKRSVLLSLPLAPSGFSQAINKSTLKRRMEANGVTMAENELDQWLKRLVDEQFVASDMVGMAGNRERVWVRRK